MCGASWRRVVATHLPPGMGGGLVSEPGSVHRLSGQLSSPSGTGGNKAQSLPQRVKPLPCPLPPPRGRPPRAPESPRSSRDWPPAPGYRLSQGSRRSLWPAAGPTNLVALPPRVQMTKVAHRVSALEGQQFLIIHATADGKAQGRHVSALPSCC